MTDTSRTKSGGTDSFKPPGEIKAGDERREPTDEGFTCIHCDRAYEGFGELAWLSPVGPCCRNVHSCRNRCSAEIGYLKDTLKSEKSARERAEAMLKKHEYGWDACNRGNGSCSPQCPECECGINEKHDYTAKPTDYMKYCEWANIIKDTPEAPDEG